MCPKMRPVGVSKKGKKGQKLSCVKLAICPDHRRRRRPLKFCVRCRVREVVIYFKFHENRSMGLGAVRGRKSPSPIDKAHGLYNSLYYRTSRDKASWCEGNGFSLHTYFSLRPHPLCAFVDITKPDLNRLKTPLFLYKLSRKLFQTPF